MKVVTRFGEIDIKEESCIRLEDGLVGIPQAKRFCLMAQEEQSPFHWLQCLDEPAIGFAVVCPMDFFGDYSFDLQDADVAKLQLKEATDAVVLTTVTIDDSTNRVTTNLLGPIVVNKSTLSAKQVVLSNESFDTKHLLFELKRDSDASEEAELVQAA